MPNGNCAVCTSPSIAIYEDLGLEECLKAAEAFMIAQQHSGPAHAATSTECYATSNASPWSLRLAIAESAESGRKDGADMVAKAENAAHSKLAHDLGMIVNHPVDSRVQE